jgi:hypothetical protein
VKRVGWRAVAMPPVERRDILVVDDENDLVELLMYILA